MIRLTLEFSSCEAQEEKIKYFHSQSRKSGIYKDHTAIEGFTGSNLNQALAVQAANQRCFSRYSLILSLSIS